MTTPPEAERFMQPVRASGAWSSWWRTWYRGLRLMRAPMMWLALHPGFGNLVVVRVAGRRSGQERTLPLGLLRVGDGRYLGHPSGDTAWTLNVRASAAVTIANAAMPARRFRPVVLGAGVERDAVVRATFRQHPFPGNALYRLAGAHVAETGVFFRLDPE